jgi:hypothetical protein
MATSTIWPGVIRVDDAAGHYSQQFQKSWQDSEILSEARTYPLGKHPTTSLQW